MSLLSASLAGAAALLLASLSALGAPGDRPVKPLPHSASAPQSSAEERKASLPARGLFDGDRLTARAKQKLGALMVDAVGVQVEVALLVPTGPWKIDGKSHDENSLTPARLAAIKRYLAERGVDAKHIYVESRIEEKIKEPRLDVHVIGKPAVD